MRSRSEKKASQKAPKYSTEGWGYFEIRATVQTVKEYEKAKCDYITVCIYNEYIRPEYYQNISIRIPYDLDVLLTPGDKVVIMGEISTLWDDNAGRTITELVATKVDSDDGIQRSEPSDEVPM